MRVPDDVQEKLLRFGRAAVAVATMRGKSYLQIGSVTMGIGGSIMDQGFIESYLGMRVESVDEVEILRRMDEHIYNEDEYQKALAWIKEYCKEGWDKNPDFVQKHLMRKRKITWEFIAKMAVIIEDLYQRQPEPAGRLRRGSCWSQRYLRWFPGSETVDRLLSRTVTSRKLLLNTSFDWNGAREPFVLATENDALNGLGMLFMKLLTNRAQMFADVRTCWNGKCCRACNRIQTGRSMQQMQTVFIHLINSGACCLDASGDCKDENGNAVMKEWYNVTEEDQKAIMDATQLERSR